MDNERKENKMRDDSKVWLCIRSLGSIHKSKLAGYGYSLNNSDPMEGKERTFIPPVPQKIPAITLVRLQHCMKRVYYRKIKMSASLLTWGCGGASLAAQL